MPIYSVQGPDGRIYDVEGPAGASEQQIIAAVRRQLLLTPAQPQAKGSGLGDIARSLGMGAVGAAGAVASAFGADNAVARTLGEVGESLQAGLSPVRQAELQKQAERMKRAEESGSTWEEVKAGLLNVLEAPLQSTAQAVGSIAPMLATAPLAKLGLGVRAMMAVRGAIGGAQGAGAVKQNVFEAVYEAELKDGKSPEQAKAAADRAQSYVGANLDQIVAGAGLGAVAGTTGAERLIPGGMRAQAGAAQQALAKRIGERGATALTTAAAEAPLEGLQGAQERLAANVALQREGRDVGTFTGVAGQAAQEALMGGLGGGAFGAAMPDRSASIAARKKQEEEQRRAAAEAEAAKNTPEALTALDQQFREADTQLQALNQQIKALEKGKKTAPEDKAQAAALKQQRDDLLTTYRPLRQEYQQRKGAIDELRAQQDAQEQARQAQIETQAAAGQPTARLPLPSDLPGAQPFQYSDTTRLMDQYDQLRTQVNELEQKLAAGPDVATQTQLMAQREQLRTRMDEMGTAIEERGGVTEPESEFNKKLAAAEKERLRLLELGDFDAAAKQAEKVQTLQARAPYLQELKALREKAGQTRELFPTETPQPEAEGIRYVSPEGKPIEPFAATAAEAAPLREERPEELAKVQAAETKVAQAQTQLDDIVKTKDMGKLYETLDSLNKAQDEASRAKADVGRPTLKPAVLDLFSPANLINEAYQRGDAKLLSDLATHADRTALRAALDQTTSEREQLVKILDSRLDLGGTERAAKVTFAPEEAGGKTRTVEKGKGEELRSVKRERADLFSQMYTDKQQAAFKNGTNAEVIKRPRTELVQEFQRDKNGNVVRDVDGKPVVVREYNKTVKDKNGRPIMDTVRLQDIYDKGGPAAVEYENVMQEIEALSRKVTTKQGNAKLSLYEKLVDVAQRHEALLRQLESGVATPTMREKTTTLQAKLGKGEAAPQRQLDAGERARLKRQIVAAENEFKALEGQITPVRDQILKLYNSLYKTTPLEKPSEVAEKKAKEARVYRTQAEQGAKAFIAALEKASQSSTGEKGLRQIGNIELDLQPDKRDENTVYFSLIRALKGAEKGEASKVLNQITDLADRHGVTLVLQVEKVGKKGLTAQQLQAWYTRNGFKPGDMGMYRKPQPVQVQKVAVSRTAKTAARFARGDVRKEAEASPQMRQLAEKLGRDEPEFDKFGKGLMKKLKALEDRYGKNDFAVTEFRIKMYDALNAKALELGKKTPEYKATLKEQVAYFQEVLPTAGKQEVPTKRTGPVTRKQTAAPSRLVTSSPESKAQSEAEALRLKRRMFKDVESALESEKYGTAYRLKEGEATTTVDTEQAQKVIDGLKLPDTVKFVYAPTADKIPVKLLRAMARDGVDVADGMVKGAVFPDGTVLVVGDQHADVKDLEQTIAHELIGHYGIDTVIGLERLQSYVKKTDVVALAEQIGGKPLVSEVLNTVRALQRQGKDEDMQKLQALREVIAHTEEAKVTEAFREKAGRWLKELVGMVRTGLRDLGLVNAAELSTSDVFYMLKQARKAFANKSIGPYRTADGMTAFRLRKQGSPYESVGAEPSITDKVMTNMLGLAGRVQFVDQYAALDAAIRKGLDANVISDLEATNANYLLRFGQQRSQFAGQFLTNGPVKAVHTKKADGVETVYKSTKGVSMVDVAQALNKADVGNDTEREHMFTLYLAGKRANDPKVGWEKLNFTNPTKAKAEYQDVLNKLAANKEAKDAFDEAAKLYQQYNAGLLDFLVDTGAMSAKKAAELKSISYVPFYRINANGEVQLMIDKEHPVRISSIKEQPQLKELVGGNTAILPVFTSAAQNTFMLTDMGLRNQAVKETAFVLKKLGIASVLRPGKGPTSPDVVRFYRNGEPYYAMIDTDAYGVPAELIVRGMEGIKTTLPAVVKLLGIPADILRSFVVRNPSYAIRQIIRDPLNAWMTNGTDAVPVLSSMKELASMVAGRSEAESKLMEAGAVSSNVFSGDERDMAKFLKDLSAGKSLWSKAIARLDAFALQGDAATRAVIYKDSLTKGMTEQEALLRTLESMNFSRRGVSPSMQALSILIPFFNAQIQGLDVIYRAMIGKMPYSERLKIREKMVRRGALMAGLTLAYAAFMEDDEAYKRARPEERYANWFVHVPGISEPVRVPIPFEMGFLFKALPEAIYNMALQDEDSSKAMSGIFKLAAQTVPLSLPQAVKPLTEAVLGKSFYGGDIESGREKQVVATQRYRENTTELSKLLGAVTGEAGVSPITLDYLIRGYTGGLGIALIQLANPLLASDAAAAVEKPSLKPSKVPFIGGLFQPVEGRGTLDEAYSRMQDIQQAKGTFNKLVEEGKRAEAMAFAHKYADKISMMSVSGAVQKRLGDLAAVERQIRSNPDMSTAQKDAALQQLDKAKTAIARQFLAVTR